MVTRGSYYSLAGVLARLVPSETQFRAQNPDPRTPPARAANRGPAGRQAPPLTCAPIPSQTPLAFKQVVNFATLIYCSVTKGVQLPRGVGYPPPDRRAAEGSTLGQMTYLVGGFTPQQDSQPADQVPAEEPQRQRRRRHRARAWLGQLRARMH